MFSGHVQSIGEFFKHHFNFSPKFDKGCGGIPKHRLILSAAIKKLAVRSSYSTILNLTTLLERFWRISQHLTNDTIASSM